MRLPRTCFVNFLTAFFQSRTIPRQVQPCSIWNRISLSWVSTYWLRTYPVSLFLLFTPSLAVLKFHCVKFFRFRRTPWVLLVLESRSRSILRVSKNSDEFFYVLMVLTNPKHSSERCGRKDFPWNLRTNRKHKRGVRTDHSLWFVSTKVRFKNFNQTLINPDHIFNQGHDRNENFSIRVCLKNFNQSLLKIFQPRSGCKKLTTCALLHNNRSRRRVDLMHGFSIKVCWKIFNQGPVKKI